MQICAHLHAGVGNRLFQLAGAAYWAAKTGRQFVWVDTQVEDPVHNLLDNMWLRQMVNVPQFHEMSSLTVEHARTSTQLSSRADLVVLEGYSFEGSRVDFLRPQIQDYIDRLDEKYADRAFLHVRLGDQDQSNTKNAFNIFSTNMLNQQKEALSREKGPLLLITNGKLSKDLKDLLAGRDILEGPSDPREAFDAMIQCSGGICANSTQSWMAAQFQTCKKGFPQSNVMIPRPWARLQDWAKFVGQFKNEEPMTDEAMHHPIFTPVDYETHNWTAVEFSIFGLIALAVLSFAIVVYTARKQ